jgi:hypothetical protein
MTTTRYRIDWGRLVVTTPDADAAERASRDGARVTAVTAGVSA